MTDFPEFTDDQISSDGQSLIRPELNLEKWPGMWRPPNFPSNVKRVLEKEVILADGNKLTARVTILPSPELGTLTTEDQKALYGIILLWEQQGKPQELAFSIRNLLKTLGKTYGSHEREALIDSLKRLKQVSITWENSFYDKQRGRTVQRIDLFNIFSQVTINTETGYQTKKEQCAVTFAPLIDSNLRLNYTLPTRFKVLLGFRGGVAQLIYKYLEPRLYKQTRHERKTGELLQEIGINSARYKKLSNRVSLIQSALRELEGVPIQDGILHIIVEPSTDDRDDHKLVAVKKAPTPGQLLSIDRLFDSVLLEPAEPEPLPLDSIALLEKPVLHISPDDLVHLFLKTFRLKRTRPLKTELALAEQWVAEYELTPDIAQTVVDFAHAESRRTNFQVQNLAGISQYLDAALASNATPVAPVGDQPQQTSFLSFADPPPQTEDEKEQAYQILSSLPLAEQEHWAELAREELKRSNSAVFKRISTFSAEVQLETLLSNAAKFFTGEILGLKTRVKAPKKPRIGS